jgi:hypothetical protein
MLPPEGFGIDALPAIVDPLETPAMYADPPPPPADHPDPWF